MATYKVIQDIEAEDKFIGPLTLKQFIFAGAAIFFGYLNFFAVTKGAYFLMALFTPPMALGIFLAVPWSKEQSTEVWVLAKLRFRIKPKIRVWDQSGLEELVTITVPKKIEKTLTNGLDQYEVESRLKALAETIDTRGWATKNATLNTAYSQGVPGAIDRLINPATLPQQVPDVDLSSYNDVLDDDNTVSSNFNQMIRASEQMHRQQSLDRMEQARHPQPTQPTPQQPIQFAPPSTTITPQTRPQPQAQQQSLPPEPVYDEALLTQRLKADAQSRKATGHLRTLPVHGKPQPVAQTAPVATPDPVTSQVQDDPVQAADDQAQAPMTNTPDAAIIDLARNNDLNIETIARQAKKKEKDDGEVVISLR